MISQAQLEVLLSHAAGNAQPFIARGHKAVSTRILVETGRLRFESGNRFTRLTAKGRQTLQNVAVFAEAAE